MDAEPTGNDAYLLCGCGVPQLQGCGGTSGRFAAGRDPRAIKELEHTLGEPLFYRNTRHMRITDFGEQLAHRAKGSIAELDELFRPNGSLPESDVAGTVRITAPTAIGRRFLLNALSEISVQYPQIRLDLRLSDTITDVIE